MADREVMMCNRVCCMNDPDKGCLLGGIESCRVGTEQVIRKKEDLKDLPVEKLLYVFTVKLEGVLEISAETEDDSGRVLKIVARGADGKCSRRMMLAHASVPTGYELQTLHRCLKDAITDVVTAKEG